MNRLFAAVVICLGFMAALPANAANAQTNGELARRAFSTLLEMQKINCHLHLEAANPSFRRARTTWLWDTANGLATEGGLISATSVFWDHSEDRTKLGKVVRFENGRFVLKTEQMHSHNRASGTTLAGTLYPQIAGQAIGGGGSLFELSCDLRRDLLLSKHKLDQRAVESKMIALNDQLSVLVAQIKEPADDPNTLAEKLFLLDLQQNVLREFIRLDAQAANIGAGQYIEDTFSLVRNTVGLIGNSINADAVIHNNKRFNGEGTILNLVSATLITVRPIVSNLGAQRVKRRMKRRAARLFPNVPESPATSATLSSDIDKIAAPSTELADRIRLYRQEVEKLKDEEALSGYEANRLKQIAVRRYRESFYGPTKQAQSILGLVVGFQHDDNTTRDNRLSAAGNTTYMTGQAFNLMELFRERLVDEHSHSSLKNAHMLAVDRLNRQLSTIEQLQTQTLSRL